VPDNCSVLARALLPSAYHWPAISASFGRSPYARQQCDQPVLDLPPERIAVRCLKPRSQSRQSRVALVLGERGERRQEVVKNQVHILLTARP
jgi:hypothetical protein